jgi:hypothetical protein
MLVAIRRSQKMGLISWFKDFCWHDWHYHKKENAYAVCWNMLREKEPHLHPYFEMSEFFRRFDYNVDVTLYQRVCKKCGICQDTYTDGYARRLASYENYKEYQRTKEKEYQLGEQMWEARCKKNGS